MVMQKHSKCLLDLGCSKNNLLCVTHLHMKEKLKYSNKIQINLFIFSVNILSTSVLQE